MSPGGTPLTTNATSEADRKETGPASGPALYQMMRSGRSFSGNERHCCFLNLGNGKFADISSVSGFDFPDDGRAVARCDWDADGDLDIWIANRTGPQVRFLRNDLQTSNHFLTISLEGRTCNRDAIGARVVVRCVDDQTETAQLDVRRTLRAGEGFLAQSSKRLHFGLGAAQEIDRVEVDWPGGEREVFSGLQVDRHYHLIQDSGSAQTWTPPKRNAKLRPQPLAPPGSAQPARVVSSHALPLPRLEYETLESERRWLHETNVGQPILINLWATWCEPCLKELRDFGQHQAELQQSGLNILALAVDPLDEEQESASADTVRTIVKSLGFQGQVGWATTAMIDKLELVQQHLFDLHQPFTVPTSLLIDANGQLAAVYRGPVEVGQLLKDVEQLPHLAASPHALPFAGRWRTRRDRLSPLDIAWRLVDNGYVAESVAYIEQHQSLLASSPQIHRLYLRVGNHLLQRGEAQAAVTFFRNALKIQTNYRDAQNNLAWVLSTHPDASVRNGKEALAFITAAIAQSPDNAFSLLDTQAAAYAELGQFEQAVSIAERAIEFATTAGQQGFARGITKRLEFYRQGKPYREP